MPLLLGGAAGLAALTACQPARLVRRDPSRRLVLRMNIYGTAPYAPLLQMRERRLLEDAIPGMWVEWKVIPPAEAVNEALRDGGIDIACGPPTAFYLAREADLPVRVLGGVSAVPCAVVGRPGLRSLGSIKPRDRIAVPEESSLETAVLQLAALRELGDARALDGNLVYRPHSEALPALKQGKEFAAHVGVTPFLELELEGTGPERLVDGRDLFGGLPSTAIVYALPALRERAGPLVDAFTEMLTEGARLAAADPVGAARLLSETEDLRIAPERLGALLERSGWQPGARPRGITRIAELWQLTGRLRQTPTSWSELAFDGVVGS
ncbi:MAG: ABC transporter substrate-binding protein [Chloroflexi bacterium]|nr:ABC transporter substrate-binding protein [Chloroflexota bacterium]